MPRKVYSQFSPGLHWLLCGLVGLLTGCAIDDLPRREFPKCTTPSAQINTTAQLLDVNFSLESTTGTTGNVTWDFGDGNQTKTPVTTTARHVFASPGTYKISVKLTNDCGDAVTITKDITVDNTVLPIVTTKGYSDVNVTTATLSMVLENNGNGKISRYGICYSPTEGIPTIFNSLTVGVTDDLKVGSPVSFTVGPLLAGTAYYFRGFAINNAGPNYGSVLSFISSLPPAVTTIGATQVGITTASVTFVPTSAGSPPAAKYGICYSATTNTPTVGATGCFTADIDSPTIGANTVLALTNLLPNTAYSYRAFAINAAGTVYSSNTLTFTTQTDVDLTTGLIAAYSFDGNGNDASGNKNNGAFYNGATFGPDRKGKASSALLLDGIDDYFDVPDAPSLRPASISVSVWVKPSSLTGIMQIYNKSNFTSGTGEQYSSLIKPSPTGSGITINVDIKQNSGCVTGQGWQTSSFTSTTPLNTWHHLVAVFEGKIGRLYFDGALLAYDTLPYDTIDNCAGGSLKFGAQYRGFEKQTYENYFNGSIDDIRIYNRALTETQVKALFNQ